MLLYLRKIHSNILTFNFYFVNLVFSPIVIFFFLTEAPGAGAVKFNIPKRPYVMANQTFPLGDQPPGQTLPNMTATTMAGSVLATATVSAGNAQAR